MARDLNFDVRFRHERAALDIASVRNDLRKLRDDTRALNAEQQTSAFRQRALSNETTKLTRAIHGQSDATRLLRGNFVAYRNVLRNLALQVAIVAFDSVAASIDSVATSAITGVTALSDFAGALGIAGGAGVAAGLQGIGVAALGLGKVLEALTQSGTKQKNALQSLTPAARQFVKELQPLRNLFLELRALSQKGMFPGLLDAVHKIKPVLDDLRGTVYNTAKAIGYDVDVIATAISKQRKNIHVILTDNISTLQKFGRITANFGTAFILIWKDAIPLIDHVWGSIDKFSGKFKTSIQKLSKDGTLHDIFQNLQISFDNWTGIFGNLAKIIGNVWYDIQPVAHLMERDLLGSTKKWADYVATHGPEIQGFFLRMREPMMAFLRLVGDIGSAFVYLGNQGAAGAAGFFTGLDQKLLPILLQVVDIFNGLLPSVGQLVTALLDFVSAVLPSIKSLLDPFKLFSDGLVAIIQGMTAIVDYANTFSGALGGITAALEVGTLVGGWMILKKAVKETGVAIKNATVADRAGNVTTASILSAPRRMGNKISDRRLGFTPSQFNDFGSGYYNYISSRRGGVIWNANNQREFDPAIDRVERVTRNRAATTRVYATGRSDLLSPGARSPYRGGAGPFFTDTRMNLLRTGRVRPYGIPSDALYPSGIYMPNGQMAPTRGARVQYAQWRAMTDTRLMPFNMPGKYKPRLIGGEGQALFKDYRAQMTKSTEGGFKTGLRNLLGKAGSAMPMLGSLAGSIGLSIGIPVAIAGIGLAAQFLKDRRPKPVQQLDRLGTLIPAGMAGPGKVDKRFKDLSRDLGNAMSAKNITGIQKVRGELLKLGDATANVDRKHRINQLASDLGALQAQASNALLGKLAPDFQTFDTAAHDSIGHVMDALAVLQVQITAKLPVGSVEFKDAMATSFGEAAQAIDAAMQAGVIATKKGMQAIIKLYEQEFTDLGFDPHAAKNLANQRAHHETLNPYDTHAKRGSRAGQARGGYVGGRGLKGLDSVPMGVGGTDIMVAPGEYVAVFNRHQQNAVEGAVGMPLDKFFKRNDKPHHFSGGGFVPMPGTNFSMGDEPKIVSDLIRLSGVLHKTVYGISGYRSPAHSIGVGGFANDPHTRGAAADIGVGAPQRSTMFGVAEGTLRGTGLYRPYYPPDANEVNHVELIKGMLGGARLGGGASVVALKKIAVTAEGAGNGVIAAIANAALANASEAANSIISSIASSYVPSGGGGAPNANAKLAQSMMGQFGWGGNQWSSLFNLGERESGWLTDNTNPSSGAFGIGQFLGGTLKAYARWGANARGNAAGQINAMLHYIRDRYGNPDRAWAHEQSYNWYDAGGLPVPPPVDAPPPYTTPAEGTPVGKPPKKKKTSAGGKKPTKKKKTSSGKKKPKGKKVYIAPTPNTTDPIGVGAFKPSSHVRKLPMRKKITALIEKQFKYGSEQNEFTDPLTGESIGPDGYLPTIVLNKLGLDVDDFNLGLDTVTARQSLTDEQGIVSLYDSTQYPDLTNYLASIGITDPMKIDGWIAEHGDSIDVVNSNGRMVQGEYIRGVQQAVDELYEQLQYHVDMPGHPALRGKHQPFQFGGGILGSLLYQKVVAGSIISDKAISERKARLQKVKAAFEANLGVRKSYGDKMKKMAGRGMTWQDAVASNQDNIRKLQIWIRDSLNEPPAKHREVEHEIDHLRTLNAGLRKSKPKRTSLGSVEYNRSLAIFNQRGAEDRELVGDPTATAWTPGSMGGFAGRLFDAISFWRSIDDTKQSALDNLKTAIPSEQGNISQLTDQIQKWTGTRVQPQPVNRSGADVQKQIDELKIQELQDQLRGSLVGAGQFKMLAGFAQLLGSRSVGAYAHGGLITQTGMALVHKDERIIPDPNGPFRNGMNAPRQNTNFVAELHLHGNADSLVQLVDTRVREVAPGVVSKRSGQAVRRLVASPGKAR